MRDIERRAQVSRRVFLRTGAAAVPVAIAAGEAITPAAAWAQEAKNLPPAVLATMVKAARDIFPHDRFADAIYIRAVTPWDAKAADPAVKTLLVDGVARLDQDAHDRFGVAYAAVPWEADRVSILQANEKTAFFGKLRGDLVVSLYNQPEVWAKLGYEGSSAEYGGYIHRGFNDIDWLQTV